MKKIKPLPPKETKIDRFVKMKLWFMSIISLILWTILLISGTSLVAYYTYIVWNYGFFYEESLKYAILLIIGAYFCLILDRKKIDEALGIRRDLSFITPEQIERKT